MATHGTSQVTTRAGRFAVSADDPVPAVKITAPGVPVWAVQRPRITKLIAEDVRWCQLTVVTGPPGAGKTTALALWAVAEPGIVAWVCLDEIGPPDPLKPGEDFAAIQVGMITAVAANLTRSRVAAFPGGP